jgi:DNA-binding NtrC family response regulator
MNSRNQIDCVVLTAFDSEFTFLKNIWALAGIRAHHANTVEQADFLLMATDATVLLSDVAIVDCSWRPAVNMIGKQHPLVAMLLMADPVEHPFLVDAFKQGVCGVIWKPIQFDAATKLVRTAHQAWEDRYLLREDYARRAEAAGHDRASASEQPSTEVPALMDGEPREA